MNNYVTYQKNFYTKTALKPLLLLLITTILLPGTLLSKVVKVEIKSRETVSTSPDHFRQVPYEVIKGIIHLEVNPDNPANQLIVDLKLAKRNPKGNVEFSTDFELHKPVDALKGNRKLIYFVNNRGNKIGNWHFNAQAGKNWLYSTGWSYLWCGWNCDVPKSDRRLNITVPVVTDKGKTITGKIYAEMISYANTLVYSRPIVWGGSIAYAPVSMDQTKALLTKRQYRQQKPVKISPQNWQFARFTDNKVIPDPGSIYIKDGFQPSWLYDLVYEAKDPKVTGLGMAAIRDVVSYFKYDKDTIFSMRGSAAVFSKGDRVISHAYAWGHSQSARLLNHFVYQNFNGDEKKRMVFDGIMANCPGAGKGLFNSRFAQFTRHGSHHEDNLFPVDFFPFTTVEQYDPITGEKGDGLARARKAEFLPKMVFINSATDYWTRAASLLHTDVNGIKDKEIDANVHIYSVAGIAHVDDRIGLIGRALLVALDQWASTGQEPPQSQIPSISNGTLVSLETFRKQFPAIPNVLMPDSYYHPLRLDLGPRWKTEGITDFTPPKTGPRYGCLIPQVDADGNEIAGIRLPEIEAPLATFTGWRMRNPTFSRSLGRNTGRVWPLPLTAEERKKNNDPRKSILERYPSKKDYIYQVTKSLLNLKKKRLLLDEDVSRLLLEAAQQSYWPAEGTDANVYIKKITASPNMVQAGGRIRVTIEFTASSKHVLMVRALFREANNRPFKLNDEGLNGDENAFDNTWSCTIAIPGNVPAGQFHFDFFGIDIHLNPITFKGAAKQAGDKKNSLTFTVK